MALVRTRNGHLVSNFWQCVKKKFVTLTNRMWFSIVCTLIDNYMRHHRDQNVVGAAGKLANQIARLVAILVKAIFICPFKCCGHRVVGRFQKTLSPCYDVILSSIRGQTDKIC